MTTATHPTRQNVLDGCTLRVGAAVDAVMHGYASTYRIRTTSIGGHTYVETSAGDTPFVPVGRLTPKLDLVLAGSSPVRRGSRRLAVIALVLAAVWGGPKALAKLAAMDWTIEVEG